jgi:uncharacterized membrane protein
MLSSYLILTGLAVIEPRGAVLYGLGTGINPIAVFLITLIANVLTLLLVFWFLQQANFRGWAKKLFGKSAYAYIDKNKPAIDKWGELALFAFVAVPLPMTGGWMGALIATILNMDKKKALIAIILGVLVSTALAFAGIGGGLFILGKL